MPRFSEVNAAVADTGAYLYVQHNQTLPYGTLVCDGSSLSVAGYPKLFAKIGTAFGGDGVTTFKLPDLRGRSLMGSGLGAGLSTSRTLNSAIGEEGVSLTAVPLHAHTVSYSVIPNHTHGYDDVYNSGSGTGSDGKNIYRYNYSYTSSGQAGDHSHTFQTANDGSNSAHNNIQPSLPGRIVMVVI